MTSLFYCFPTIFTSFAPNDPFIVWHREEVFLFVCRSSHYVWLDCYITCASFDYCLIYSFLCICCSQRLHHKNRSFRLDFWAVSCFYVFKFDSICRFFSNGENTIERLSYMRTMSSSQVMMTMNRINWRKFIIHRINEVIAWCQLVNSCYTVEIYRKLPNKLCIQKIIINYLIFT